MDIKTLLSEAKATAGSSAKFESQLDAETVEELNDFVVYLQAVEAKTENSARSYKSYVAKALVLMASGTQYSELSSDVRSGVNALARFQAWRDHSDTDEPVETDEA